MISGMRVRRRSSAGGRDKSYKYYQLVVLTPGQTTVFYLAQLGLIHPGAPDGIPTGGTITASAQSGNNPASAAFDDTGFSWGGFAPPQWVRYEFPVPIALTAYFLRALDGFNGEFYTPRSWRFEASNDAVTWEELHAETVASWEGGQVRTYPL